jgi:hypothetical protein
MQQDKWLVCNQWTNESINSPLTIPFDQKI